ncbi:hypothetical protein OF83DRAFT_1059991 [Amylostereum chailletii]|nr:hypothetical protein OF83DRAFT_1059991 [Amylostereum chailletii]
MLFARTLIASNPSALLEHISRLPPSLKHHNLLFTLSLAIPADVLSALVSALSTFSVATNVGSLSAPLPGHETAHACALAVFDKAHSLPFRSDIPGRIQAQVGKWHQMREGVRGEKRWNAVESVPTEGADWEKVWGRIAGDDQLPSLLKISEPKAVHTVLMLTDNAPQGLNNALSVFPNATKLGMIAASTPFVTGRPYTLFHNTSVYSSGAVGIALSHHSSVDIPPHLRTDFPGLTPMTDVLTVTRSEGNLVHELDAANPSRLLLDSIAALGIDGDAAKEDKFFLGVLPDDSTTCSQMYHIMSGDPSRGTIALESDAAPGVGTRVQVNLLSPFLRPNFSELFHRSAKTPVSLSLPNHTPHRHLTFVNVSQDHPSTAASPHDLRDIASTDDVTVLDSAFVGASENGFVCSRPDGAKKDSSLLDSGAWGERAWTCSVAGGTAGLTWRSTP